LKLFAAAAERNREPILEILRDALPSTGTVLEVASGTGQHAVFFAGSLPHLQWQPSDADPRAVSSITAYREEAALPNLLAPISLDVARDTLPADQFQAIVCINMIHIAPFGACLGLLRSAGALPGGAPLVLYGPFAIDGDFTAPSNVAFDRRLRSDNPEWGVRELRDVERAANAAGLRLERIVPRPANNHVVVFRRDPR
jgi:hypothetical protein